jgi:hypothetical protein
MLDRLPAAAVPSGFVLVERPPTQPNGKIDRRALDRALNARRVCEEAVSVDNPGDVSDEHPQTTA